MMKYKVEFILARNNYFYFHLLLSSTDSTAELNTVAYIYFVSVVSFFKILHDSGRPENIFSIHKYSIEYIYFYGFGLNL